jgi:TPR repeat protein
MYGEGLGVSRDENMAAKWFIEAAKQENVLRRMPWR